MITVTELVNRVEEVSSLPATFVRVSEMLEDPECRSRDLAAVIEMDPALTVKLLRLANSAFYGFRGRVDSVARAIGIIGFLELKSIVLTLSVRNVFQSFGKDSRINVTNFWEHSLACAITSRTLGERHEDGTEGSFVAGFLHDLGRLILLEYLPEEYHKVFEISEQEDRLLHDVEKAVLGFTHADVGGEIVRSWDLPPSLYEAVTHHHNPSECEDFVDLTTVVHIADVMVNALQLGTSGTLCVPPLNRGAWLLGGLDPGILEPTVQKVTKQLQDARAFLVE